jgi:CoA:oxalate CoA-transferase
VLNDEDLYADPHLEARGFFQRAGHPSIGEYLYPGHLWKFGKSPRPPFRAANGLGEHNGYVYGHLLGMSDDEIRRLEEQNIIGDRVL